MSSQVDNAGLTTPYVGLRPFEEKDRSVFFGRERDLQRLINQVYTSRVVVVFAPSGVGKTSLLRAGLVPRLRKDRKLECFYFSDWRRDSLEQMREAVKPAGCRHDGKLLDLLRSRRETTLPL